MERACNDAAEFSLRESIVLVAYRYGHEKDTEKYVFLSPKWSGRGVQSRKNHLYLRVATLVMSIR